jgi:hypothetical protein
VAIVNRLQIVSLEFRQANEQISLDSFWDYEGDLPSIWRFDPGFEVVDKTSFAVFDGLLELHRFLEGLVVVPSADKEK